MPSSKPEHITAGLQTTSAKIRALDKAGYQRADIARILGKRYQHVRNVLVQDQVRYQADKDQAVAPEPTRVKIGPEGRIVIPAQFRQALKIGEGDALTALVRDDEIVLMTTRSAIRKAQAIVRQLVPEGVSLVDELIAERRQEDAGER